jgi:uncharacterized protein YjbI with pentapeptide repeats
MMGCAVQFSAIHMNKLFLLGACSLLATSSAWIAPPTAMAGSADLIRLLESKDCKSCKLQDADLVHADLRDADLSQAQLQRANLGQARLDGAQLSGANLTFTSLTGASLRGADLRGARLEGTDLRQADLSGALLDPGALSRSHCREPQASNQHNWAMANYTTLGLRRLSRAAIRKLNSSSVPPLERIRLRQLAG